MADTMLHFNGDNLSVNFLTKDELRAKCPKAFADAPTNPDVSDRYVQANTEMVIDDLAKLGWYPVDAKQCREKANSKGIRSFHMVAFQNPDVKLMRKEVGADGEGVVEAYPRIILTNSHDGFNAFKFMVGLFRLVCSNGLVIATEKFADLSIRHMNYDFEALRQMVASVVEQVEEQAKCMTEMLQTEISDEQAMELAEDAIRIRKGWSKEQKVDIDQQVLIDLITPKREEDKGTDLWRRFNIIQEGMMKGDFSIKNSKGKNRKSRPLTSVTKGVTANRQLFQRAYEYTRLAA